MLKSLVWIVALVVANSVASVSAQDAPLGNVTVDQLVHLLAPRQALHVRGLGIQPTELLPPRVDLAIPFDYDSAVLNDKAKAIADVLAEALQTDQLKEHRFRLIGHTDAKGAEDYNQVLSLRRALAVEKYLISAFGIGIDKLEADGMGETQLLFPDQPEDGRNRRVEVQTID